MTKVDHLGFKVVVMSAAASFGVHDVTHGLDSEAHAGLHSANGPVLRIMWDIGRGVKHIVDAVSCILADDGATSVTGNRLAERSMT